MANDNFDNLGREQNKEVQDVQFYKQAYQFGDCHHFEHSADFLIMLQT